MTEKYFDLHIDGIGYLNRAREVSVRGGSFLAVDITALHGEASNPEKTRFDCRVSGSEAQALIRRFMDPINDRGHLAGDGTTIRHKVLAGFRLGDLYPETFTYEKGDRAGQAGVSLKARLLRLEWVKIDGEMVYKAQRDEPENQPGDASKTEDTIQRGEHSDEELIGMLPTEVALSKDDPEFEAKKTALKQQGYRFDSITKVWRLHQVA